MVNSSKNCKAFFHFSEVALQNNCRLKRFAKMLHLIQNIRKTIATTDSQEVNFSASLSSASFSTICLTIVSYYMKEGKPLLIELFQP